MKIGFVCTNYNNSSYTGAAIASLHAGGRRSDVRVVVVDNRSQDADVASLEKMAREFPHVELVPNPANLGYFAGLNIGIRHLRTTCPDVEHLVVGNNDLMFPHNFVETVKRHRSVFDTWAVVAPDLVTLDGVHQNPHVLHPISRTRKLIWDLYFLSYGAAVLIRLAARLTKEFTVRQENAPDSELFKKPGPIEQGYGACYLLGPVFFRHFSRLCAPTFMMHEEFFLYEQLKGIGQMTYYDPRFVVYHHGHVSTDQLPSMRYWRISQDAHRVYKRYLRMSPAERASMITSGSREPSPFSSPAVRGSPAAMPSTAALSIFRKRELWTSTTVRPCRICGTTGNSIVASETPCALWGERPWMPEGHYTNIRCRKCGCHYVDSDVTENYLDELQATHIPENENRTTYEATQDRDNIRTAELAENWQMITRIRKPRPGDKLLDYGSAWGAFGNVAKQSGVIPNGVELQAAGAAFSRDLWGEPSTVHQGPIETAPFSDNTFEYVTSFETLEHVFDPIRILANMKRLVKGDGVVAISVPSAHYFTFKYWVYRKSPFSAWMMRNLPGNMEGRVLCHNHITTPSLRSAKLMMGKAGLKVIYASPYCSGLSGGRVGTILRIVGELVWILSFKQIVLAPSIFLVAVKRPS